jgi:hypothetical protein
MASDNAHASNRASELVDDPAVFEFTVPLCSDARTNKLIASGHWPSSYLIVNYARKREGGGRCLRSWDCAWEVMKRSQLCSGPSS